MVLYVVGRLPALERADDAPFLVDGMRAGRHSNPCTRLRGETTTPSATKKAHIAIGGPRTDRLNPQVLRALWCIRTARNVVQCIHVAKLSQPMTDSDFDCYVARDPYSPVAAGRSPFGRLLCPTPDAV